MAEWGQRRKVTITPSGRRLVASSEAALTVLWSRSSGQPCTCSPHPQTHASNAVPATSLSHLSLQIRYLQK